MTGSEHVGWRKSSRCESSACVEVAIGDGDVEVRNSTDPATTLTFSPDEWAVFIAGVKAGEFDGDQPR